MYSNTIQYIQQHVHVCLSCNTVQDEILPETKFCYPSEAKFCCPSEVKFCCPSETISFVRLSSVWGQYISETIEQFEWKISIKMSLAQDFVKINSYAALFPTTRQDGNAENNIKSAVWFCSHKIRGTSMSFDKFHYKWKIYKGRNFYKVPKLQLLNVSLLIRYGVKIWFSLSHVQIISLHCTSPEVPRNNGPVSKCHLKQLRPGLKLPTFNHSPQLTFYVW